MIKFSDVWFDAIRFIKNRWKGLIIVCLMSLVIIAICVGYLFFAMSLLAGNNMYNLFILCSFLIFFVLIFCPFAILAYNYSLFGKEFSDFKFTWGRLVKYFFVFIFLVLISCLVNYLLGKIGNNIFMSVFRSIVIWILNLTQIYIPFAYYNEKLSFKKSYKLSLKMLEKVWAQIIGIKILGGIIGNGIVALKIMSIYPYLRGYGLYNALPMLLRALSDPFMIFIIIVTVLLENALIGSYFYNLKKLYYNEESGWTI